MGDEEEAAARANLDAKLHARENSSALAELRRAENSLDPSLWRAAIVRCFHAGVDPVMLIESRKRLGAVTDESCKAKAVENSAHETRVSKEPAAQGTTVSGDVPVSREAVAKSLIQALKARDAVALEKALAA